MKIIGGNAEIVVDSTPFMENTFFAGSTRPCLRFSLVGSGVTPEQLVALTQNPITIVDDDGNDMGTYQGYNTVASLNLVLVQVQDYELTISELEDKLRLKDVERENLVASMNEDFNRREASLRAQAATDMAKALSEAQSAASAHLLEVQLSLQKQIDDISRHNDLVIEEVIATVRKEYGDDLIQDEPKAWDESRLYISGDWVPGYIAVKYSRGKKPEDNVGTYWAHYVSPDEIPFWDDIPDGETIPAGKIVYHDDLEWCSITDHIRSSVFEPGGDNSKWEKI